MNKIPASITFPLILLYFKYPSQKILRGRIISNNNINKNYRIRNKGWFLNLQNRVLTCVLTQGCVLILYITPLFAMNLTESDYNKNYILHFKNGITKPGNDMVHWWCSPIISVLCQTMWFFLKWNIISSILGGKKQEYSVK